MWFSRVCWIVVCTVAWGSAWAQMNFFECAKNPAACGVKPAAAPASASAPASSGQAPRLEPSSGAAQAEREREREKQELLLRLQEISKEVATERDKVSQERRDLQARLAAIEKRELELANERRTRDEATVKRLQTALDQTRKRVALVIGNAAYLAAPLKNPLNDASDISHVLKESGFEVIQVMNGSKSDMRAAIREFGDKLLTRDVGLFYYSGHGIEVKGRNYLIPVNADVQREDEVPDQSVDVGLILEKMATADKGVNIVILDACRDNPFARSFRSLSRGLALMDAPRGTLIAYSTSPGRVAYDGDAAGRNSPYTRHLLENIRKPNVPIEQIFKEVRRSVFDNTKGTQIPWENTSLRGDFYFRIQ